MSNVVKTRVDAWPWYAGVVDVGQSWVRQNGTLARLQDVLDDLGADTSGNFTTIDLGSSGTTLSEVAAGRLAVEGAELAFARYYDVNSPAYAGSIQAAIDAASTAGGGTVMVPYGTYALGSTGLTAKSSVCVMGLGWPVITYTGSGEMIGSASTGVLTNFCMAGFVLNHGASATHGINLRSAYHCHVDQIRFRGSNTSVVALRLGVNTSGSTNNAGNRNAAFNKVSSVFHDETCGTFVQLEGGSSASEVVTLNEFQNMHCFDARVRGWDFAKWCDNNYCTFSRVKITGNNTVGVEYNTADPTNNVGVYTNNFGLIAVDTFGTYTGRVGIKINNAKQIKAVLYQNPKAEGGSVVVSTPSSSYQITEYDDTTGSVLVHSENYVHKSKLTVNVADSEQALLLAGASKGVRVVPNASGTIIAGVDNTGAGSYEPLTLDGSQLNFSISGTAELGLNATSLFPQTNDGSALGGSSNGWADLYLASGGRVYHNNGAFDTWGTGTPEGAVTAPVGSTFRRTDGGAGTSFYVKESGSGNTGWVGK